MSDEKEMTTSQQQKCCFFWGGNLHVPFTLLALTQNIVVKHCYLSNHPVPLQNKIECIITGVNDIVSFQTALKLTAVKNYYSEQAQDFCAQVDELARALAATEGTPSLYITIPILKGNARIQKTTTVFTQPQAAISIKAQLYGSLYYSVLVYQGQQVTLADMNAKIFTDISHYAPPFKLYMNGVLTSLCDKCPLSSQRIGKMCIYYTSNYECIFTHCIDPLTDTTKLSAEVSKSGNIVDEFLESRTHTGGGLSANYDPYFEAYWDDKVSNTPNESETQEVPFA